VYPARLSHREYTPGNGRRCSTLTQGAGSARSPRGLFAPTRVLSGWQRVAISRRAWRAAAPAVKGIYPRALKRDSRDLFCLRAGGFSVTMNPSATCWVHRPTWIHRAAVRSAFESYQAALRPVAEPADFYGVGGSAEGAVNL
jgi:hypothetical protein